MPQFIDDGLILAGTGIVFLGAVIVIVDAAIQNVRSRFAYRRAVKRRLDDIRNS